MVKRRIIVCGRFIKLNCSRTEQCKLVFMWATWSWRKSRSWYIQELLLLQLLQSSLPVSTRVREWYWSLLATTPSCYPGLKTHDFSVSITDNVWWSWNKLLGMSSSEAVVCTHGSMWSWTCNINCSWMRDFCFQFLRATAVGKNLLVEV